VSRLRGPRGVGYALFDFFSAVLGGGLNVLPAQCGGEWLSTLDEPGTIRSRNDEAECSNASAMMFLVMVFGEDYLGRFSRRSSVFHDTEVCCEP
jgi:hypothetical protein